MRRLSWLLFMGAVACSSPTRVADGAPDAGMDRARDAGPSERPAEGGAAPTDAGRPPQAGSGAMGSDAGRDAIDAGAAPPPDGAAGHAAVAGGGGNAGGAGGCSAAATVPLVLFVIDGSGSMCADFDGTTRWQALRSALLDPNDGVIPALDSRVAFGVMIYDGTIDPLLSIAAVGGSPGPTCAGMYTTAENMTGDCPALLQVAPALDGAAAIDAAFPATELGGSTPTHKAMNAAVDSLIAMTSGDPGAETRRMTIVLATDGQPNDICVGGAGGDSIVQQRAVLEAVDRGAAAGITTLAISLAGDDASLQSHLEAVAARGQPANPSAAPITPATRNELADELAQLLDQTIGCRP